MTRIIEIHRIYDPAPPGPTRSRILVDRLWPRGISREKAAIDFWAKDWAPSEALRTFFHAHPEGFQEFQRQYRAELLTQKGVILEQLEPYLAHPVLLLFASRNTRENNAVVLKAALSDWLGQSGHKTTS
ncbi:MAG: DUF488 domain-containing protein [Leptospirales bacterium]